MTCSTYFPGYLPSLLTKVKSTKHVNISDFWFGSAYIRGFYIKNIGIKDASIRNTYTESTYISNPKTVKYLEIYLQSFENRKH